LIIGFLVATVAWALFGLPFIYLHWDWLMNEAAGFFTFLLVVVAVFQLGLFVWQLSLIRQSLAPAQAAANAALLSARAAIGIQLPIIRVTPDKLGFGDTVIGGVKNEDCSVHSVTIYNVGATKAFPKEIIYGFTFGDKLPEKPSYQFSDKFSTNAILPPGPDNEITRKLWGGLKLEPGQRAQILKGNCLWFYCAVLYDDFMDEPRSREFCWRWSSSGMGLEWRIDDAPAYNRKT
jgi:hypothetical protein